MRQIASIYFSTVKASRPLYGGYYEIPAVPKEESDRKKAVLPAGVSLGPGGTFLLNIDQKIQRSQEPGPDGKRKVVQQYLVTDREISTDILREWTRETVGMTPDCGPGMWIVRDEVPLLNDDGTPQFDQDRRALWRQATDEEKKEMWAEDFAKAKERDANWAQYLINDGDRLAEDPKMRVLIGPLNKQACRAYGRDREWLEELKDGDTKVCDFCTKRIAVNAIKCPHCQEIVDPRRYAQKQAEFGAVVESHKGAVKPPLQKTA